MAYIRNLFSENEDFPFYAFLFKGDKEVSYDDRDIEFEDDGSVEYNEEIAENRITHHVTLRNLEENTKYSFAKSKHINTSCGMV